VGGGAVAKKANERDWLKAVEILAGELAKLSNDDAFNEQLRRTVGDLDAKATRDDLDALVGLLHRTIIAKKPDKKRAGFLAAASLVLLGSLGTFAANEASTLVHGAQDAATTVVVECGVSKDLIPGETVTVPVATPIMKGFTGGALTAEPTPRQFSASDEATRRLWDDATKAEWNPPRMSDGSPAARWLEDDDEGDTVGTGRVGNLPAHREVEDSDEFTFGDGGGDSDGTP
jgi:hypothetical protein